MKINLAPYIMIAILAGLGDYRFLMWVAIVFAVLTFGDIVGEQVEKHLGEKENEE